MIKHPMVLALLAAPFAAVAAAAQTPQNAAAPLAANRPSIADTSPFRQLDLPTPNGFRSASGMPGPQYWQQKASYTIQASLDTATHTIQGDETILYRNNSPDTLRYLWLQLDMNAGSQDTRFAAMNPVLRPEAGFRGGVTIETVHSVSAPTSRAPRRAAAHVGMNMVTDEMMHGLSWRINSTMMRVDLDTVLAPRQDVTLHIRWHYQIPRGGGRTGRQQYPMGWLYQVAQWYPRLAVYDDVRGWGTDQYIGAEFYLEYGDFDVTLTLPAGFTVGATGVLKNPTEVLPALIRERLAAAAHSDTIVRIIRPEEVGTAAILPPNAGATRTWHYTALNVRDFAWATAPNYIWDATSWDGISMQAFYPPDQIAIWRNAADITRHSIMIHSRWFHFPYPTAISAEGPVGGMEYPMMTFDNARDEKDLYYTIAHEQGHEWFPMIVGSEERLYPWMDEGFNTFIDWYSFHDRYPTDTTRIQTLEFGAMSAYQGFLRTNRGAETPIMEPQDRSPNGLLSGWNAYGKPAVGLHFLREQVVDSMAFDAAFREYVRRWAFHHPTPADFFRSMNDGLGEDLSWFWRSWFVRTDHLDQAIDSVTSQEANGVNSTRVFLSSRREMVAPVELRVTAADGSTRIVKLPVETWLRGSTFIWRVIGPPALKPVRIEIDPRGVYPDVDRSNNSWSAQP
ncbi:MAG TPA: M1 family metallopeptidase [Gemmatimonadales bacterium]|jgi:hypothetical protein